MIPPGYFRINGAAEYAGVAPTTVRNWINHLGLPSTLVGRVRLIAKADLDDFIERQGQGGKNE